MGTCMPPFCLWTGPTVTCRLLRAAASSPPTELYLMSPPRSTIKAGSNGQHWNQTFGSVIVKYQ